MLLGDARISAAGRRVRLLCGLTKYRSGLVAGSVGTVSGSAQWGVLVKYDNGDVLDTLVKSLELFEPKDIAEAEQADREWEDQIRSAPEAKIHLGPAGGFRCVSIEYVNSYGTMTYHSNGDKQDALKILKIMLAAGKPVQEVYPYDTRPARECSLLLQARDELKAT